MRKLQKAALAAAMVGSLSLIATGTASAQPSDGHHGHGGCKSHDMNIDILGQVGVLPGLAGNLLNGEGNPGAMYNDVGSDCHH
ncbi:MULTISPECIES: hypothetical protein [Streptomyces]|uniref:hypothetical protein n=1 Tax=Streptomyces TaxID=1883 RepID=UPI0004C81EE6|nr:MULTISPECIES: hypothetical protein [unclassified Streptomyces]SEC55616.1 hypothetical protein SAMN05216482_3740 [Streptomyces sp. PAN_FS17]SED24711.1 hypothetical protein SAMN05428938_4359 [Streptomyces sp. KS_5]